MSRGTGLVVATCIGRCDRSALGRGDAVAVLVTETLGEGGFGVVYKGYDPELRRTVAIKVPRAERVASPAHAEAYLTEARVLAGLDHPHIVPAPCATRISAGWCTATSKAWGWCSTSS